MTTMITFRGKARPRRRTGTAAVLGESARLRNRLTDFAEELKTEIDRLKTEVDRLMSDREEDGDEH